TIVGAKREVGRQLTGAEVLGGVVLRGRNTPVDQLRSVGHPSSTWSRMAKPVGFGACCILFFFQAEDGIRDWSVTGVQTCALPIWLPPRSMFCARSSICCSSCASSRSAASRSPDSTAERSSASVSFAPLCGSASRLRSEERRVGKEGGAAWWAYRERERELRCA